MSLKVQAISSHPVLVRAVEEILGDVKEYPYLPSVPNESEATSRTNFARLFLLDACSLSTDLGLLAMRCSASSPGSKFIALLPPAESSDANKIRLFYCGIDGFVELSETWKTELPKAIRSVLGGQQWARPQILAASVKHEQTGLRRGKSLTAREGQILRLVTQRLTNKEISRLLAISERTVKFHVSNILAKLGLEDRRGLLSENVGRENIVHLGPAVRRGHGSKAELKRVSRK